MSARRTLVTGFLGFGRFVENPSEALARGSGRPFALIEVRYDAVDAFLDGLDPRSFDRLLMLGVAGGATGFRLERLARDRHGPTPDVRGHVPTPGAIVGRGDAPATLWCDATVATCRGCDDRIATSDDAGDYLCNYALCRALSRFPAHRVGFLHVPPVEAMPLDAQSRVLATILDAIERDGVGVTDEPSHPC